MKFRIEDWDGMIAVFNGNTIVGKATKTEIVLSNGRKQMKTSTEVTPECKPEHIDEVQSILFEYIRGE